MFAEVCSEIEIFHRVSLLKTSRHVAGRWKSRLTRITFERIAVSRRLLAARVLKLEQVGSFDTKDNGEVIHQIDGRAVLASLKRTHIGAMNVCAVGKLFLGKPSFAAHPSEICRKNFSNVHKLDETRRSAFIYRVYYECALGAVSAPDSKIEQCRD